MKTMKLAWLAGLLLVFALPAAAQPAAPKVEFASGFAYATFDLSFLDRENTFGYQTNFTYHLSETSGLSVDFAQQYGDFSLGGLQRINYGNTVLLGGPRFTASGEKYTYFTHTLVGLTHLNPDIPRFFLPLFPGLKGTHFALGAGGGLDLNMGDNSALRIFQVDYIPVRESGVWKHNFRVGFGFVIKISGGGQ